MGVKWNNPQSFDRFYADVQRFVDEKSITWLAAQGEKWVKKARLEGPYKDRTSNLRNSIGYIIVQNGRVVSNAYTGNAQPDPKYADKADIEGAHAQGQASAEQIAASLDNSNTYLILTAGMQYAVYVERKGYWVLSAVKSDAEANQSELQRNFERYLSNEISKLK